MSAPLRVAVGGLGAVGRRVAAALDAGIPGLALAAASARDTGRGARWMEGLSVPAPLLALEQLAARADVVVECAPAAVFRDCAAPAVDAGRVLVAVSAGQLLAHGDLVERAGRTGARILVPSGAILGLDAIRAAAEGEIREVRLVTRKPPRGLAGAPYLERTGIALEGLDVPVRVFEGSVRDGIAGFPANVNVAVAVSLAGIGPDRTRLEVWADPTLERNTHRVAVEADSARFEMSIENVPTEDNPRTGRITALSVVSVLRGLAAPLVVGA